MAQEWIRLLLLEPAVADVDANDGSDNGSDGGRDHTYCQHRHDTEHNAHLLSQVVLPDESRSIGAIITENFQLYNVELTSD